MNCSGREDGVRWKYMDRFGVDSYKTEYYKLYVKHHLFCLYLDKYEEVDKCGLAEVDYYIYYLYDTKNTDCY